MAGASDELSSPIELLRARLGSHEKVRRLGQALWMSAEEPLSRANLIWSRGLLGLDGDEVLWNALLASQCLREPEHVLDAPALGQLLGYLFAGDVGVGRPRLVWTLPSEVGLPAVQETYVDALIRAIDSSRTELIFVSPFLGARGIGRLTDGLLSALHRGVEVLLLTHGAEDHASLASEALRSLHKDATGLPGRLSVWAVDSHADLLVHSKLVIADGDRLVLGSANLTGRGLGRNVEAGIELPGDVARNARAVVQRLLASSLVRLAFAT